MHHKKEKVCIETAWAPGTMNIFQALKHATLFHIQVLYITLITPLSPLNLIKPNVTQPNLTQLSLGATLLSFAFIVSQTFLDLLSPSMLVLARSHFIIYSLISTSPKTERNLPPNSSKVQATWCLCFYFCYYDKIP